MWRSLAALVGILSLASCYSPLRMSGPVPDRGEAELHDGILVYLPRRSVLSYRLDRLVSEKGNILKAACEPAYVDEVAILPDTTTPYRVGLRVPIFGSSEAGIELTNGMLSRVALRADAKVPETLAALADTASALRGAALQAGPDEPPSGMPFCNAGRRLVAIDRAEVAPFGPPAK